MRKREKEEERRIIAVTAGILVVLWIALYAIYYYWNGELPPIISPRWEFWQNPQFFTSRVTDPVFGTIWIVMNIIMTLRATDAYPEEAVGERTEKKGKVRYEISYPKEEKRIEMFCFQVVVLFAGIIWTTKTQDINHNGWPIIFLLLVILFTRKKPMTFISGTMLGVGITTGIGNALLPAIVVMAIVKVITMAVEKIKK